MKTQLDIDKIAKALAAGRRGTVRATGGYFGAMQLLADVEARFAFQAGAVARRTPLGRSDGSCRSRRGR
jgi:hypothetical protein